MLRTHVQKLLTKSRSCLGRDRMEAGIITTYAITKVNVSLNPVHSKVYSIQHYVIKFVSDLRLVGGFLWAPVSFINKTDCHDITEILLKVAFNIINHNHKPPLTKADIFHKCRYMI